MRCVSAHPVTLYAMHATMGCSPSSESTDVAFLSIGARPTHRVAARQRVASRHPFVARVLSLARLLGKAIPDTYSLSRLRRLSGAARRTRAPVANGLTQIFLTCMIRLRARASGPGTSVRRSAGMRLLSIAQRCANLQNIARRAPSFRTIEPPFAAPRRTLMSAHSGDQHDQS